MTSLLAATVCFVGVHTAPSAHFKEMHSALIEKGIPSVIFAAGDGYKNLNKESVAPIVKITDLNLDTLSYEELDPILAEMAKKISDLAVKILVVDVCSPFSEKCVRYFASHHKEISLIAYYENPKVYVDGYSKKIPAVVAQVSSVAFANQTLAIKGIEDGDHNRISLAGKDLVGIGLFLQDQVEQMKASKANAAQGLEIRGRLGLTIEKAVLVLGGANEDYFNSLEKFLDVFKDTYVQAICEEDKAALELLKSLRFIIQQHPRVKKSDSPDYRKDNDRVESWAKKLPEELKFLAAQVIFSPPEFNTIMMFSVADWVAFRQTTMSDQALLAKMPLIHIGLPTPDSYDLTVSNGLCAVVQDTKSFLDAFKVSAEEHFLPEEKIYELLGVDHDGWKEKWVRFVETKSHPAP